MKKFFYLAVALAAFVACDKGSGNAEPEPEPTPDPVLNVTPMSLEFAAEGEAKSFTITANNDWTATEDVEWLSLDKTSGAAGENVLVTVTAVANATEGELTASIVVTAGGLTKNVAVSQAAPEVVVPPSVDQSTIYELDGLAPLYYASDFEDGALYAILFGYESTKCWTVNDNNELTMSTYANAEFNTAQVFECKKDDSKLTEEIQAMDTYYKWSACAFKSLKNDKYIKQDFNVTGDLADALWIAFANNWGGYEDSGNVGIVDQYRADSSASSVNSLWYDTAFEWGDNGLYYENGNGTNKRKSIVYKVKAK